MTTKTKLTLITINDRTIEVMDQGLKALANKLKNPRPAAHAPAPRILRNSARCKACGAEVESKHTRHLVGCGCGKVAVDGGREYIRRLGNPEDCEDTSIFAD